MGLRVLLCLSALVAVLLGGAMLFMPDALITSMQLGTADVAARAFARSMGGALISVAVINLMAMRDDHSPALFAILIGNLLLHLTSPAIDFLEPFPKETGFWVGVAVHAVFAIAFAYYVLTWNRAASRTAA